MRRIWVGVPLLVSWWSIAFAAPEPGRGISAIPHIPGGGGTGDDAWKLVVGVLLFFGLVYVVGAVFFNWVEHSKLGQRLWKIFVGALAGAFLANIVFGIAEWIFNFDSSVRLTAAAVGALGMSVFFGTMRD